MPKEIWSPIPEFPNYSVSNLGRILNERLDRLMALSQSNYGHAKVALLHEDTRQRFTRSVALLVADAFIEPPDELSDSVILLDGDLEHVAAVNLAWRPRWFAWKYARQLRRPTSRYYENLAVYNVVNRRRYPSIEAAGMREGLLFEDIWYSTYTGHPVYPQRFVFRVTERV